MLLQLLKMLAADIAVTSRMRPVPVFIVNFNAIAGSGKAGGGDW
jgi:hypothetical protein